MLEQLPHLGSNSAFGRELQFVQNDTHEVLADPIRGTLRANQCFYVIARQCFVEAVPFGKNDKILPQAFSFHTEVRLQAVHLPDTVVCLRRGHFAGVMFCVL